MAEVVIKATVVLCNKLTVPGGAILNEVVKQCVTIFDDAFENLAHGGNWPRQGPAAVCEYMKNYLNSDYSSVPWQNEAFNVNWKQRFDFNTTFYYSTTVYRCTVQSVYGGHK